MPTFYKRKVGVKPRCQWDQERLREAVNRIEQGEISCREAERYYGVPARTIKRRMTSGNLNGPGHGPSCKFILKLVTHSLKVAILFYKFSDSKFCDLSNKHFVKVNHTIFWL